MGSFYNWRIVGNSGFETNLFHRFRYRVTLKAPTAMVEHVDEIPVKYLNKGQIYWISIVNVKELARRSGTTYQISIRITFEAQSNLNNLARAGDSGRNLGAEWTLLNVVESCERWSMLAKVQTPPIMDSRATITTSHGFFPRWILDSVDGTEQVRRGQMTVFHVKNYSY